MFYTLHRIYLVSWVAVILGGMVWLYPRTGISEPLINWYEVWQNAKDSQTRPVDHLEGKVIHVMSGEAVTLRTVDRQTYSIGLVGAVVPPPGKKPTQEEVEQASHAKERLSELTLSNDVDVAVTWMDPQHRGVGVVHVGETNVNAMLIQEGYFKLNRAFIKTLPVREQYALIRADRHAKR